MSVEDNDSLANEIDEEPPTKKKKSEKGDNGIPRDLPVSPVNETYL